MQNERFVNGLYSDLLGRNADPAGRASHVYALDGGTPRRSVVETFLLSTEYTRNHVEREYLRYLKRAADAGGRNSFAQGLQNGMTFKDLAVSLGSSGEYLARHPPADAFIRQLYSDVLGRQGEAAGVAAHVAGLAANGNAYRREVRVFLDSGEHHRKFVIATYQQLLGRQPTTQERDQGASQLSSGATLRVFIRGLAASQEYFDAQQ